MQRICSCVLNCIHADVVALIGFYGVGIIDRPVLFVLSATNVLPLLLTVPNMFMALAEVAVELF